MRIGTWNLEGRWTDGHRGLLTTVNADVWLLTEVSRRVFLPGFEAHVTTAKMGERRHWAGVFSRFPLGPLPDPHPASAAAVGGGGRLVQQHPAVALLRQCAVGGRQQRREYRPRCHAPHERATGWRAGVGR